MTARRIVVIGGGIAGLAAAWAARRTAADARQDLEVLLLERGARVGGKANSVARDGWLIESGPSGYLSGRPEMDGLVEALGLAPDRVPANRAASVRFLYRAGKIRRVVPNPVGLLTEGILGPLGVTRMLAEPFVPRRHESSEDESVWSFAARRFGRQVADRMVRPMALGIFAGDARRLSLRAAFPRMAALEREHGSVTRAMIARRGSTGSGTLTSFRHGMQQLPRALGERGGFAVRCNASARALNRTADGWSVVVNDVESIPADAVVLAGEPWAMAPLLRAHAEQAATELEGIACPPVGVVALGFGPAAAAKLPVGFGLLVARGEGFRMLGTLWESHLYEGRGPSGHLLVRAMFGGAVDPEAGGLPESELAALGRSEVGKLYGLRDTPLMEHVVRVPRAIPQYELGHTGRVARITAAVDALPGLSITGNGLRGVSFADAASDGVRVGSAAARRLTESALPSQPR